MSQYGGDNQTHKGNVSSAEATRQVAVAAAGNSQSAVSAAEVTFYRTCLASAKANNVPYEAYVSALKVLGVGVP
jgi:hypothetical protein